VKQKIQNSARILRGEMTKRKSLNVSDKLENEVYFDDAGSSNGKRSLAIRRFYIVRDRLMVGQQPLELFI
jgi:hypothetical protein